jgi:hypothetical protein
LDIQNRDHKSKSIQKKNRENERNRAYDDMLHTKPRQSAVEAFKRPAFYKRKERKKEGDKNAISQYNEG